jgi:hypothetical protein
MLCFVVASFAAIQTVIVAVFHQAHIVFALAEHAKALAIALAATFRLVALHANEWGGHSADSTAKSARRKVRISNFQRLLTTASAC